MDLRTISICAGVGGLDLGVRIVRPDARCVAFVEREASAAASLVASMEAGRLHPAPVWSDLRIFDAGAWRGAVDCVLSGDPCQGNSVAGKRLGADDDRWLLDRAIDVFDQSGAAVSSAKTYRGTSPDSSKSPSLHWKDWAAALRREYSARLRPEHATDVSGSSSWPTAKVASGGYENQRDGSQRLTLQGAATVWMTPNVPNGGRTASHAVVKGKTLTREDGTKVQLGLEHQAQTWATPKSSDGEKGGPNMRGSKGDLPLPSQAARWPSPMARDHKGGGDATTRSDGKRRMDMLDWRAEHWQPSVKAVRAFAMTDLSLPDRPTPSGGRSSETRRRLNPLFVEWLMGWPEGLSGFDTAGTASCHSPQPSLGCDCMDCWLTMQRAALSALLTIAPPAQQRLL